MIKNKFVTFAFVFLVSTGFVFAAFDFSGGVSGTGETSFETGGGAPLCKLDGDSAWWEYSAKDDIIILADGVSPETLTSGNGCSMEGGLPSSICCPLGYQCNTDSGACVEEVVEVVSCAFYDGAGEDSCESANVESIKDSIYQVFLVNLETELGVGSLDIPALNDLSFCDDNPQIFTLAGEERIFGACGCVYDSTDNSCESFYLDVLKEDEPDGGPFYRCVTDLDPLQDRCDTDGVYSVEWTAERIEVDENGVTQNPPSVPIPTVSDCSSGGPIEFECVSRSALPFFTMINFLVSSLVIALMYFVFRKKF